MDLVFLLILVLIIVIFSGLVSGSEAALLSSNYAGVKELAESQTPKKTAVKLLYIKENLRNYITSIVVLNNVINIVGSIYVGVVAVNLFGEIYLGIFSGVLTFLIIMFSEIIPKIYGERYSLPIALIIAYPLYFIEKLLSPLIYILNLITNIFVRGESAAKVSEGQIKVMAAMGKKEGSINAYEGDVIENVFRMNDLSAYDIMIPKRKTDIISKAASFKEIVDIAESTGHTRFPVSNEKGEVIGLINVKDLFKFHNNEKNFTVSKILRPITYAPEVMKIFDLEQKLKKERIHMAAIVNEHGDFVGIATLEDVIEELLGDIVDEFDNENEVLVEKISDNKYLISGDIDIEDLNDELGLNFDIEGDYTTLNGFITNELGKIPKVNDKVKIEKGTLRVIKASKRKAISVELIFKNKPLNMEN